MSEDVRYLEPTQDAGRDLIMRQLEGPVVMLNLLRFAPVADYSATPELAPATAITGEEAYERYIAHATPFLLEAGGELVFMGTGGSHLIGPAEERWDRVLLVRHQSVDAFMSFATHADYLAGIGHRTAALQDSRLLPMVQYDRGGAQW